MDFSISCMLIASDMEYLNSYLKYSFKVDDYYEDNNNHELEVPKVQDVPKLLEEKEEEKNEEEYQESEEEEDREQSEEEEEEEESDEEESEEEESEE